MSSRLKTSAMARARSSAKCAATGRRSSRSSGWAPIASPSAVRGRAAASRRSRSPALGSGSYPTRAGAPRDTRCPRWPARSATCADRCETAHSPAREVAMPNTVVVTREEAIAVVQLNRPDVLNALNEELMKELVAVLSALDDDDAIRCIVLTGRRVKADEAKAIGLVAQVYPAASWLDDAKALARTIAEKPPVAVRLATEAIDLAWNATLDAGLEFERKAFYLLFATEDKKEGVDAFVGKRKAIFKGR